MAWRAVVWRGEAAQATAENGLPSGPFGTLGYSRVPQGAHKMKKIEDMTGAVNKPGLRHEWVMPELVISANCDQAKAQCPMALCGNAGCDGRHSSARVLDGPMGLSYVRTYCALHGSCRGGASTVLRRQHCLQG